MLAYGRKKCDEITNIVEYVDMETLLAKSDINTLHIPATEDNYHFIDEKQSKKMKSGVVIFNTSRGSL